MQTETKNSVVFSSEILNVVHVEKLVGGVVSSGHVCEEHYGKILIAVTEAVNNAILHGNQENPEKRVMVSYEKQDDMLFFCIKDEGCGFNPENLPDPTDPENRDKPNGRGVFLMKNLADSCEFFHAGCEVRLGFRLNSEGEN
jgi:serine/threonine-protein kinase RsbW